MQIHELNKRQQVDEVDLVGPNSIFNVGKQVLKNPAAMTSSSALGAAQQASAQASAASSADKLAAQGYKVGGSIKPPVTTAQQLQKVKSSPAVQAQVKNLSSQWMAQSAGLKKATTPVSEAVAQFNPRDLTDPKYASVLKAIQARDAGAKPSAPGKAMPTQPYQVPGAGTTATPAAAAGYKTAAAPTAADQAKKNLELEKDLTVWKEQFKQWTDQRLATQGITMDMVRQDGPTAKALDSAMTNVAVAAQSGDPNLENQAVEDYLNLAIAGIQAYVNNSQQAAPRAGGGVGPAAVGADDQQVQQVLKQLEQLGISKTTLGQLGKLVAESNRGSYVINNTGNPFLNIVADQAGLKIR